MPPKKVHEPLKCKWLGCPCEELVYPCVEDLAHHVKASHIESFAKEESVVCLWEGCRVYNVPSTSYSWLQKHVQQVHTKERPHRCIMNGCSRSFNSADALNRHLQVHFLSPALKVQRVPVPAGAAIAPFIPEPTPLTSTERAEAPQAEKEGKVSVTTKTPEGKPAGESPEPVHGAVPPCQPPPPKRPRTMKPQIVRHTPLSSIAGAISHNATGIHFHPEVLDTKTMSVIRKTACHLAQHDKYHSPGVDNYISLQPSVIARRKRPQYPEPEFLVRWVPPVASDVWIPASQYEDHSHFFSFRDLSPWQLSSLAQACFSSKLSRRTKRKL
ncbi:hypothetical protein EMCRGX_G025479 [Ephydatia muelleri]|eukprot:Em0021g303a